MGSRISANWAPESQPVTPGRLQMLAWPPDKDLSQEYATSSSILDNYTPCPQDNNEEITDITQANLLISQLKTRLQHLKKQLEKNKITSEIEFLTQNTEKNNLSPPPESNVKSKKVQTDPANDINRLLNTPVINIPETVSIGTYVNTLDLSSDIKNNVETPNGSEKNKIESSKIREYKTDVTDKDTSQQTNNEVQNVDLGVQQTSLKSVVCDTSTSDESFQSTTSTEMTSSQLNSMTELHRRRDLSLKNVPTNAAGIGLLPPPMSGMMCPPQAPPGPGPPPPLPGPSMGPGPFPAPLVGRWNVQRATLRKTAVKPAVPMKPLYWTRILALPTVTHQMEQESDIKPLWLEIDEAPIDNIDEFTDLFSRQVIKTPVKKNKAVSTKNQDIKISDSLLAQSLHVKFSEIANTIYNFDTSVVSVEALLHIYELRAIEELSLIKEHLRTNTDVPLDRPEAYLHDQSSIPNLAKRVSCFMFLAVFEDAISTTMHTLDNLKRTCEFLTRSEPLKKLFAIILTLGNYMNGGNGQCGQADGFGLEILAKLKDVKSKQSDITLLHFIVDTYMSQCGGALSDACALPVPEPGDVARAAAIHFNDVGAQLAALRAQLTGCKAKTKKVLDNGADADDSTSESKKHLDEFKDIMSAFLKEADEKLNTVTENLDKCKTKFIATVKFYQYTPKTGKREDCEPKEFFSLWTAFCSDVKDIYKREEQMEIVEKFTKMLAERSMVKTIPKREGGLKARLQKLGYEKKL